LVHTCALVPFIILTSIAVMTIVALLVLLAATSNIIPFRPIHLRFVESPTDIAEQVGVDILMRGATLFADAVEVGICVDG